MDEQSDVEETRDERISRLFREYQEARDAREAKKEEEVQARRASFALENAAIRARVELDEQALTNMADDNMSPGHPRNTARDKERAMLHRSQRYWQDQRSHWVKQIPKHLHQVYRGVCIASTTERIYRSNQARLLILKIADRLDAWRR